MRVCRQRPHLNLSAMITCLCSCNAKTKLATIRSIYTGLASKQNIPLRNSSLKTKKIPRHPPTLCGWVFWGPMSSISDLLRGLGAPIAGSARTPQLKLHLVVRAPEPSWADAVIAQVRAVHAEARAADKSSSSSPSEIFNRLSRVVPEPL